MTEEEMEPPLRPNRRWKLSLQPLEEPAQRLLQEEKARVQVQARAIAKRSQKERRSMKVRWTVQFNP